MRNHTEITMCPLGFGADREGIGFGYLQLYKEHPELVEKITLLPPIQKPEDFNNRRLKYLQSVTATCTELAKVTDLAITNGRTPILIGGDHSLSLGSIKGILPHYSNTGILWVDAHGDMNTDQTTQSGNIHGMPLSALQGYGHPALTGLYHDFKVPTENIVIFGVRDLDKQEAAFMKHLGVRWYDYCQIYNRGFNVCLDDALNYLRQNTDMLHISLDLDVLDPMEISGVSVPVSGGFQQQEIWELLYCCMERFNITSMDIVEYNPLFDQDNLTLDFVIHLIKAIDDYVQKKEEPKSDCLSIY